MEINYQLKQKRRIETFGFEWFAKQKRDEFGNKRYPKKMKTKEEVVDHVNFWKNCDGCKITMSVIEGPGFYIAIENVGHAHINAFWLGNYNKTEVFEAYNLFMHHACGHSLYC